MSYIRQGLSIVPINKMKLFYFFSEERKGLNEFLNLDGRIKISILCDRKEIGHISLNISEFKSPNVNRKGYNTLITGLDFRGYLRVFPTINFHSVWLESMEVMKAHLM
jgi:hypothetical protein